MIKHRSTASWDRIVGFGLIATIALYLTHTWQVLSTQAAVLISCFALAEIGVLLALTRGKRWAFWIELIIAGTYAFDKVTSAMRGLIHLSKMEVPFVLVNAVVTLYCVYRLLKANP
jgi:hypothetical protein